MERSFSLGFVVAFPLLSSALVWLGAPALRAWLGDDRGKIASVYLALFGSSMAVFFLGQAVFGALTDARIPSLVDELSPWLMGESVAVHGRLVLDPLSGVFALAVAVVATLTQIFAVGWAGERDDGHRVFAWIGALAAALLTLVLASSVAVVILAWAAVGVLAHLGIAAGGDTRARLAARRQLAFEGLSVSGLLVGFVLLFDMVPSTEFDAIRLGAAPGAQAVYRELGPFGLPLAELAVACIGIALSVRLGLFPFFTCAESSAHAPRVQMGLLQSGGLLAAVYLVVRLEALVALAPMAMGAMTALGVFAAVIGAFRALGEERIDRILTWSSVTHAGLAFAAAGMGAWGVAIAIALAHAVAKVGLALACAAADEDDGTLEGTRVRIRGVAQASFWLSAGLGGLVPTAGFFALEDVAAHVLLDVSAFSDGINYLGFVACLAAAVGHGAAMFRLHYRVFSRDERPRERAGSGGADEGAYVFATVCFAALALGMTVLWAPALTHQPRLLEDWIGPQTSVSLGFGRSHEAFAIGPSAAWVEGGRLPDHLRWAVLLAVLAATSGTWYRGRAAWVRGATRAVGPLREGVRLAAWVVAAERGFWRASSRLADAISTLVHFGFDEIVSDRGSAMGGRLAGEVGHGLARLGFGSGRRAVVGMLLGVAFVLGWLFFKPSVAALGPTQVHDFGGLRPGLARPAQSRSRTQAPAAPTESADAEDPENDGEPTEPSGSADEQEWVPAPGERREAP
jgi:NADH-quinone oxidoreductase subunit L